jgi:hypothetical protein
MLRGTAGGKPTIGILPRSPGKDRFKADLKHPDVTITEQDCKDKGIEWVTSRYWYLLLEKCVSCCLVLSCTRMYQVW